MEHGFNEVDDEILERSESSSQREAKLIWPKWGAAAACLCLIVIGAVVLPRLKQEPGNDTKNPNSGNITEVSNSSAYPYNDKEVLDYIGMPLNDLQTKHGNVVFNEITDIEAYQYYAYFERDGLQYLYQFSSNWSLVGRNISALHNPPSTLHYVKTQEECRELFYDYLLTLVNAAE